MSHVASTPSSIRSSVYPSSGICFIATATSRWWRASVRALTLKRTQTIMEGATHCDFRFMRKG